MAGEIGPGLFKESKNMDITTFASIVQTVKHPLATSQKYAFIGTNRVLDVLAGHGWQPVKAHEARVRNQENHGYQRHLLRLRNEQFGQALDAGDVIPEIALVNSHGGASSFQLYVALLEKVCSNGLIVERGTASHYRITHVGYADEKVSEAIRGITRYFPEVLARREEMQNITLDDESRHFFAETAGRLRFGEDAYRVAASDLLLPRHTGQSDPTLWNTLNVIQENVVRGGLPALARTCRKLRTKPIQAIAESVRLNRGLWRLAEQVADDHELERLLSADRIEDERERDPDAWADYLRE
jgi:hypothetical protein